MPLSFSSKSPTKRTLIESGFTHPVGKSEPANAVGTLSSLISIVKQSLAFKLASSKSRTDKQTSPKFADTFSKIIKGLFKGAFASNEFPLTFQVPIYLEVPPVNSTLIDPLLWAQEGDSCCTDTIPKGVIQISPPALTNSNSSKSTLIISTGTFSAAINSSVVQSSKVPIVVKQSSANISPSTKEPPISSSSGNQEIFNCPADFSLQFVLKPAAA